MPRVYRGFISVQSIPRPDSSQEFPSQKRIAKLLSLPLALLDRVDGMVGGDLLQRLTATDRLHRDSGLELGTVGAALAHRWEPPFRGGAPPQRLTMRAVQESQTTSDQHGVLSNLKTSFSGTFHALRFDKYADRYLGAFNYRFNRRFNLGEMTERVAHAICSRTARPERLLRSAELAT